MKFTRTDVDNLERVLNALNDIDAKFDGTVSVDLDGGGEASLVVTYDSNRAGHVVDFGEKPYAGIASALNASTTRY